MRVEIQKGKGCQKEPDVIAPEKSCIPQAIAKRMAHVAACLHKEKALVLPLQCGGLLLGEQRIGMENEFHSAGLHIVIDQQSACSVSEREARGKSLMAHEQALAVSQTGFTGSIRGETCIPRHPQGLLPEAEEVLLDARPAAGVTDGYKSLDCISILSERQGNGAKPKRG